VYIYDLNDLDKGSEALDQAEDYGHELGKREKAQLADGYRLRAERVWEESLGLRSLPQEEEHLSKAKEDYLEALKLYQSIVPFGNATQSIRQTQRNLEKVEERLKEIEVGL
jgi:hypothetical protein